MPAVLIVEDSQMVLKILRHLAQKTLGFDLYFAASRAEALSQLDQRDDWLAAIVDLNLPDAPQGELVDDTLGRGIPTIVLTGSVNEEKRETLTRRGIVDYVLKEGRYSYQYAVNLVNRLYRNQSVRVLVAEDSSTTRHYVVELLSRHLFQVVEAVDGAQALQAILADPSIRMLLTDYNMPNMDGFELIRQLRHQHEREDLVIIGLSSAGDKHLSAKFIKNGADDFLYKPFSHEEFFCRIMHDIESMERLAQMREMAYTDSLTKLPNRRALIDQGRHLHQQAQQQHSPLSLALINLDHFRELNDDFGYDAGDQVLQAFAAELQESLGRFTLARTGGDEFCVVFPGLSADKATQLLDVLRIQIDQEFVATHAGEVSCSLSAGVAQTPADDLEALMRQASQLLHRAKEAGRNMIVSDGGG